MSGEAFPFVLASARDVHIAQGLRRVVPATRLVDVPERVGYLLRHLRPADHAPAVVVGALPFRRDRRPRLYQPERWTRRLPSSRPGYGVWPTRSVDRLPTRWAAEPVPSSQDYQRAVARALALLRAPGATLKKVVLARTLVLHASAPIDARSIFTRLAADPAVTTYSVPLAPSPTGDRRVLIGATPEMLVAREGRHVSSRPLAGSALRRSDGAGDRQAAEQLARSDKDLREHAVVVEWIADRLAPFCRDLRVPRSPSLVSTASMWHLGSTIEGVLRDDDTTALDLALAVHPTPALCGAPADQAFDAIGTLEPFERDFYGGAVGWVDARGDGEWHVAIRCAEISGTTARLFAGAGIVDGSDPAAEALETSGKFSALLNALGVDEHGQPLEDAS